MTNEELQAMEALVAKAGDVEWRYYRDPHGFGGEVVDADAHFVCQVAVGKDEYGEFVAAARSFVPATIAEMERLRALVRTAYYEGMEDIDTPGHLEELWLKSDAKQALEDKV